MLAQNIRNDVHTRPFLRDTGGSEESTARSIVDDEARQPHSGRLAGCSGGSGPAWRRFAPREALAFCVVSSEATWLACIGGKGMALTLMQKTVLIADTSVCDDFPRDNGYSISEC